MRAYLDTNVLAHLLYNLGELSDDVYMMLSDYNNIMLTSSVCVQELIHLVQIGKMKRVNNGRQTDIAPETIISSISEAGIRIVPVSELHLKEYAVLPMQTDHRDPNDRIIIAQAMSDRVHLVSSDRKFSRYENYGLKFIFNER